MRRLEEQLAKARANAITEESKERSHHSSSRHVTAFSNPIQTVSNIAGIIPVEYPLRPSMIATTATNIIGNAEDQEEEVHALSQPLHNPFAGNRTPIQHHPMSGARSQRRRNAASAVNMNVHSAGYQANQYMLNEGVRRLQLGDDEEDFME